MKNPESSFSLSLLQYEEKIITKLENMEKQLLEIQRDLHIQTLAGSTKIDHGNHQTNGILKGFGDRIDKMAKDIEEIKKSKK